jgi:hypothetical protein
VVVDPAERRRPSKAISERPSRARSASTAAAAQPESLDRIGKLLIIRSVYRSLEHNRAIGGAKVSKHLEGIAFDIAAGACLNSELPHYGGVG